jgi:uncharacterized protein YutE (UPF0331/DUF86 family)
MMKYAPLDINKIRDLTADIQKSVRRLEEISRMDPPSFYKSDRDYALAEHNLRRALEGILTIGTHILSRLPARTKDYQDIIVELGKNNIIPREFAEKNKKLAGYRNRMVHLYWEITPEELYKIISEHLSDIDVFCEYYREVINHPEKFDLHIAE